MPDKHVKATLSLKIFTTSSPISKKRMCAQSNRFQADRESQPSAVTASLSGMEARLDDIQHSSKGRDLTTGNFCSIYTAIITMRCRFTDNIGCDGLRRDALLLIWKEKWTQCESLPPKLLHFGFSKLNVCRLQRLLVLFKSEAIVHLKKKMRWHSTSTKKTLCQLSVNSLVMALMWESLENTY